MRDVFDIEGFRPGQEDAVRSALEGRHTLALMPTGAGKSLCYQLPALLLPGTTVVVSPLIALMKDQIEKLDGLGLDARQVNSTLTTTEEREAITHIARRRSKFVLATPERMTDPGFLDMLSRVKIDLFVIDEAHCVSQWGHDFRPAYLQIRDALASLGYPPVLALTATATPDVVDVLATYTALERAAADGAATFAALCEAAQTVPRKKARVILCLLKELKLVRELRGARFSLLRRGLPEAELETIAREYEERTRADRDKLERLMRYAQSTDCRWKLLMEYFDVPAEWDGCGVCDNCRQPHEAVPMETPPVVPARGARRRRPTRRSNRASWSKRAATGGARLSLSAAIRCP
jgi:superfamily II DNA helicase RecQ